MASWWLAASPANEQAPGLVRDPWEMPNANCWSPHVDAHMYAQTLTHICIYINLNIFLKRK